MTHGPKNRISRTTKRERLGVGQCKKAGEALHPLVLRSGPSTAGKDARHLHQIHRFHLDEGDNNLREEVDARLVPRYILLQNSL
jgi:hypothetical protein